MNAATKKAHSILAADAHIASEADSIIDYWGGAASDPSDEIAAAAVDMEESFSSDLVDDMSREEIRNVSWQSVASLFRSEL